MIKVIIFDMDGTLVDSTALQYKAFKIVFTNHGFSMNEDDWHEWILNSYNTKSYIEKKGLDLDSETIRAEKHKLYLELVKNELQLKPGARKVVMDLSKKYRLAVASASRMDTVKPVIQKFELEPYFEKLVSDFDIGKRKPHPDVFLHVAEEMGVKAEECIVLEDSPAGLKAAKAAGMICIICPDTFSRFPRESFKDADKIIESLKDISLETIEEIAES